MRDDRRGSTLARATLAIVTVAVVLSASGCAADPDDVYSGIVRQALADAAGLDADALEEVAMRKAAEAETAIWALSGLDTDLGGHPATSELVGAALTPLSQWASSEREEPSTIHLVSATVNPVATATAVGLGFVAVDAATSTAVGQTNDGSSGSQSSDVPGGSAGITVGADGNVHTEVSTSSTADGVTATVAATTDLHICPDADGRLELSADVTARIERNGRGVTIELHVDATGLLDDDANLVGTNYEYRQQYASYADGAGEFLDHSGTAAGDVTVNRHSSAVTADFVTVAATSAAFLAAVVADNLQKAAEKGWSSGRCVDLSVTPSEGPDGLEPDARLTIAAESHSTVDGQPTGGTVTASLAGEGALDPTGTPLDSPADFDFTAPGERDQTGTVSVESRSKRGIGKATLSLSTSLKAYNASGGLVEYAGAGTICDVRAPFTIPGNTVDFAFTPADETAGTWKASGGAYELTFSGEGSYTVRYADDVATMLVLTGTVRTIAPDGSRYPGPGDLQFTLTPAESCS